MSTETKTKFAYSYSEEVFEGSFATREAAAQEAFAENPDAPVVWTGRVVEPTPEFGPIAERHFGRWIEQDANGHEFADENWPFATPEQLAELNGELSRAIAAWLDRHGLRPKWFNVEDVQRHERPTPTEEAP